MKNVPTHKTYFRSLSGVSALALLAAASFAPGAQAQQEGGEAVVMEEITVTAQFREQNLQRTPLAITAMSGEMLEARGHMNLADTAAQAPNVQLKVNPAGQQNSMQAYIRGVGQGDQSPSLDPGVGIYIDGVYFSSLAGSVLDLVDVDRVEILRGPQGTLAGMNSLGGAVKLFSRKPTGEDGGYVEGTYGSYSRTDVDAAAEFTLLEDELFARLSATARHRDGYVDRLDYACVHPDDPYVQSGAIPRTTSRTDCKIGTMGGQSMAGLRAAIRWTPTSDLEVNITADGVHDTSETQVAVLRKADEIIPGTSLLYQGVPYDDRFVPYGPNREDTVLNDPYVTYANFMSPGTTYTPVDTAGTPGPPNGPYRAEPANEIDSWGFAANIDWDITDTASLKSITGYRGYQTLNGQDNDGSPVDILMSESVFDHEQLSQELRLSGAALDGVAEYTVGGILYRQETRYEIRVHSPYNIFIGPDPTRPVFDFIQDDTTVNKHQAAFAHVTWHVTDRLDIATGIRYTRQDKNYTFFRLNPDGATPFLPLSNPDNPLNGTTGNFTGDHVDYRLNAAYQWTDDVMTYAQFSTGFKGGGITPRPYYPQQVRGFGPETLNAYEVGMKSRFFDQRLQLNVAGFYNDYEGYQAMLTECVDDDGNILPVPYNSPCGQYGNVADAEVWGAEAEMQLYLLESLRIDGTVSFLDFEFQEPQIETPGVIEGAGAPGIGDHSWSIGAQYEFRLPGGASLIPRVDVTHTAGYCGDLECDPLSTNQPYTLANGHLTFISSNGDWEATLEVTNITDKIYATNRFVTPIGYANDQIGPPRQWAISVRRNF